MRRIAFLVFCCVMVALLLMPRVVLADGECGVRAVDLIGAWVDAGAPNGPFTFQSTDGKTCEGDFTKDILPLFTQADVWFKGSQPCSSCHFANSEASAHEMDLSSYEGILKGADVLSEPPGVPIIKPGDWEGSALRARLRNNRMPPGWEFDITEANRDGPTLTVDGTEVRAVHLIGAWVDAGAPKGSFTFKGKDGSEHTADFTKDVLPLFTQPDIWFEGSQPCSSCHFANSEASAHEMDLSSYEGILKGADVLSEPPGVPIIKPGDWEGSALRARLRDNRMPPGWEFDITEANRDGPTVMAGRAAVAAPVALPATGATSSMLPALVAALTGLAFIAGSIFARRRASG